MRSETTIKTDVEKLTQQKESLLKEMASLRESFNYEMEQKMKENRIISARTTADSVKLAADKAEFQAILAAFKKEKEAFEKVRQEAIDMKANYTKMYERIAAFMTLIKRESEKI